MLIRSSKWHMSWCSDYPMWDQCQNQRSVLVFRQPTIIWPAIWAKNLAKCCYGRVMLIRSSKWHMSWCSDCPMWDQCQNQRSVLVFRQPTIIWPAIWAKNLAKCCYGRVMLIRSSKWHLSWCSDYPMWDQCQNQRSVLVFRQPNGGVAKTRQNQGYSSVSYQLSDVAGNDRNKNHNINIICNKMANYFPPPPTPTDSHLPSKNISRA
jgi:aspartyl-tRNA synthetase